jgi:hypothetical protein
MQRTSTDRILTAWAVEQSGMQSFCVLLKDSSGAIRVETLRPREWAQIKTLVTLYNISTHVNNQIVNALTFMEPEHDSSIRIYEPEK